MNAQNVLHTSLQIMSPLKYYPAIVLILSFSLSVNASVLPENGSIQSGSGHIAGDGTSLNIQQFSDRLAIDWSSFSVGVGNSVNFLQPSNSSVALNRVTGGDPSAIFGSINANGRVFLINPAGVLFGASAQVNVAGLVATTLNMDQADFQSGNYVFSGSSGNAVINHGNIVASSAGGVALIAARVENTGSISAQGGNVGLAAGGRVRVNFGGPVFVEVEEGTLNAFIEQGGVVRADGGTVYMTAKTAGDIASTVINHTGVTEARTLATGESGRIFLLGDMDHGRIEVAGKLDASAPEGGDGGFIETSAANVHIDENLLVTTHAPYGLTGNWLIDPTDIIIEANSFTGTNGLSANTISTNLATTNVSIATVVAGSELGNITVNAPITWATSNTLTLTAHGSIFVNAPITSTFTDGTAGTYRDQLLLSAGRDIFINDQISLAGLNSRLTLRYGQSSTNGGTFDYHMGYSGSVKLNGGTSTTPTSFRETLQTKKGTSGTNLNYRVISSEAQLRGLGSATNDASLKEQRYALGADITMGSTAFTPIGSSSSAKFESSQFHGLGNTISDLVVNRSGTDYNGLIGYAINSGIRDVSLQNASITGRDYTGGAVGFHENGSVYRVYFGNGAVSGRNYVGGIAGYLKGSSSSVDVISESFSTGTITGTGQYIGGVLGYLEQGTIRNSYSLATVTGSGTHRGGFIGYAKGTYSVVNSYSAGSVTGSGASIGGFIGTTEGTRTVTNSYWDKEASGQTRSANNTTGDSTGSNRELARTTAEMKAQNQDATFVGWDFDGIWRFDPTGTINDGYPYFGWAFAPPPLIALTIAFNDITFTYNGQAYVFSASNLTFSDESASGAGTVSFVVDSDTSKQAINVGDYSITLQTSGFDGYNLTLVGGTLTIDPALLTIEIINNLLAAFIADNKVYDGTVAANISNFSNLDLSGILGSDEVSISGVTGAFADPNVANGIQVSLSDVTLSGAASSNYQISLTGAPTSLANITPATLTLGGSFTASDKVYDGNKVASVTNNSLTLIGLVGSEDVTVSFDTNEAEFDTKNVGEDKTVSLVLGNLKLNNGDLSGLASNYVISLADAPTTEADITPRAVYIGGNFNANDKNFDGSTNASFAANNLFADVEGGPVTGA